MTSSRLVGRSAELAQLEAIVRDAAGGRPSLAFVAGESGVGKSRLVGELARRARADGVRVLSGDCVDLGESELAYAPLVGALRPLVRDGDPAVDALPAPLRAELASILPTLGDGSGDDDGVSVHGRLFEALLELLDRLGEETPVLLVIEDLHWADRSTRGFLTFLARTLCTERTAVVATYRSDELHRRHPLRPLLAELERDPATRRLQLEPFTRAELGEQLAELLGSLPDAGLVECVHARSEGNPLFTEGILAAGLDGRGSLPPTLRDALMLRIERLSRNAQELLRLLVVSATDHELLSATSALDARAPREAVASAIVVADEDDRYRVRHALLREVLLDDLLPGERTELHRTVARALEERIAAQQAPDAHLTAQAAHHLAPHRRPPHGAGGDRPRRRGGRARQRDRRGGDPAGAGRSSSGSRCPSSSGPRASTRSTCFDGWPRTRPTATATTSARRRCCARRCRWSTSSSSRGWRRRCWSGCSSRSGISTGPTGGRDDRPRAGAAGAGGAHPWSGSRCWRRRRACGCCKRASARRSSWARRRWRWHGRSATTRSRAGSATRSGSRSSGSDTPAKGRRDYAGRWRPRAPTGCSTSWAPRTATSPTSCTSPVARARRSRPPTAAARS
jgi:AAA ATPase domain